MNKFPFYFQHSGGGTLGYCCEWVLARGFGEGFWGGWSEVPRGRAGFLSPNSSSSLFSTYKKHENIKRRAYGQRIRKAEHACFFTLIVYGLYPK